MLTFKLALALIDQTPFFIMLNFVIFYFIS